MPFFCCADGSLPVSRILKNRARSLFLLIIMGFMAAPACATEPTRFFHSGDGAIQLVSEKNSKRFSGCYRQADGQYDADALKAIAGVFGAPHDPARPVLSLRLIEFLDFLQDRLKPGALLTITSGYRAPQYNANLRKRGALAAKASLHQYGMAADIVIQGVDSKRVWETIRGLGFGGAGYYHGRTVHVDVGPARFWDEKTSGVGSGLSDDNKLIGVVTDYDAYRPGGLVRLRFIRMTAFPIGVRAAFWLVPAEQPDGADGAIPIKVDVGPTDAAGCGQFSDIDQMAALDGRLPADIRPGCYRIRAAFCDGLWDKMPESVSTPEFEIRMP
ncbi:YcbK family protein [Desulfosarcina ovata]|uniref:Murein endopeptidase K n=1 Tax=Desulfosarcina ovata subsp. ovata TaxID=2752305 RepID=A0A5K8AKS7_9BACT|nr:DUF882 domain-containing protein [Desulfosarcina ovata]BBO93301.1 hypothetical protein DSCOOX_64810 [Desulfosarcina ovata subsp. ovata]